MWPNHNIGINWRKGLGKSHTLQKRADFSSAGRSVTHIDNHGTGWAGTTSAYGASIAKVTLGRMLALFHKATKTPSSHSYTRQSQPNLSVHFSQWFIYGIGSHATACFASVLLDDPAPGPILGTKKTCECLYQWHWAQQRVQLCVTDIGSGQHDNPGGYSKHNISVNSRSWPCDKW